MNTNTTKKTRKKNKYIRVQLFVRRDFAQKWTKLAHLIGVPKSTLMYFAIFEFTQNHLPFFDYSIPLDNIEIKLTCPICKKEFHSSGFGTHYKFCSDQEPINQIKITKLPERIERLKQFKKNESFSIHGRNYEEIP